MFTARVLTGCKGLEEIFESVAQVSYSILWSIPIAETFNGILARTLRFRV